MATIVTPSSKIGKPFNFDAAAFATSNFAGQPVTFEPIQEDSLMATAKQRINSLLSGELPDEVLKQVETRAAERGFQTGLTGEAARNLTFRDLGASSMDAINAGITGTTQLETLRLEREKTNKALELDSAKMREEIRQADQRFSVGMRESDRMDATLGLEALKLQSANQQFRLSEENRFILANAQATIPNLQQNMDTLATALDPYNQGYQEFLNTVR